MGEWFPAATCARLVGVTRQLFADTWLRDLPADAVQGKGAAARYHLPDVVQHRLAKLRKPHGSSEELKAQRERVKIVREELDVERTRLRLARERGELIAREDLAEGDAALEAALAALAQQINSRLPDGQRLIDEALSRVRRRIDVAEECAG